jgi:hypothetical protein
VTTRKTGLSTDKRTALPPAREVKPTRSRAFTRRPRKPSRLYNLHHQHSTIFTPADAFQEISEVGPGAEILPVLWLNTPTSQQIEAGVSVCLSGSHGPFRLDAYMAKRFASRPRSHQIAESQARRMQNCREGRYGRAAPSPRARTHPTESNCLSL